MLPTEASRHVKGVNSNTACVMAQEVALVNLPTVSLEDRAWISKINGFATCVGTATFGNTGMPNPSKATRVVDFAKQTRRILPELGEIKIVQVRGFEEIDPECSFWKNGHAQFVNILRNYFNLVNTKRIEESMRRSLLADLGFILIDDFVSAGEEAELMEYWRLNGPVFRQGVNEQHTNRRFFHYGPILPKQSFGTTRSTLNVIPGRLGAIPPVVEQQNLRERIRDVSKERGDTQLDFDQLYVNYYSAAAKGRIGFHHDHVGTMRGVVAGISLGSACEFQLLALDAELSGQPTLFLNLPPRSLYLMSGLSRYHLQHGIPSHNKDRLSLTFRTVDQSGAGSKAQWRREWADIPPAEAAKCNWPLLPPVP